MDESIKIPSDLTPLPTMPWSERPDSMPLDREEVRTALWRARGNVTHAAALMKVVPSRLRRFIGNSPYLSAEMKEAHEQLVDKAQSVIEEALDDDGDKGRQDAAARFVLDRLGRQRGWGDRNSGVKIVNNGGPMVFSWGDGSAINGPMIDGTAQEVNDE